MITKAEDLLYPQYDLFEKLREAIEGWQSWLKEQAAKNLTEIDCAHPDVIAHWKKIAATPVETDTTSGRRRREMARKIVMTGNLLCIALMIAAMVWCGFAIGKPDFQDRMSVVFATQVPCLLFVAYRAIRRIWQRGGGVREP